MDTKKVNVNRNIESYKYIQYGSQWFSITNELAIYVLSNKKQIEKNFKYTYCSDEIFLQTLIYNSKYKNALYMNSMDDDYKACLRYIDWNRGGPYTFKSEDFESLIKSDRCFARKFSTNIDEKIIYEIYSYIIKK